MNERIKELSVWAKNLTTDEAIHLSRIHNRTLSLDEEQEIFAEKFAGLLVKECMAQCERVALNADAISKSKSKFITDEGRQLHGGMWGGAKNCAMIIKQHFGVQE